MSVKKKGRRRGERGPKKSFGSPENKPENQQRQASPWAMAADAPDYGAAYGDEAFFRENPHRSFRIRHAEPGDDYDLVMTRLTTYPIVGFVLVAKHGANRFLRIAAPVYPGVGDVTEDDSETNARVLFASATVHSNRENTPTDIMRIIEKLRRSCARECAEVANTVIRTDRAA